MKILATKEVALDTLKVHPENPRQGDVGIIGESLEKTGQYRAIVVRSDTNEVLAGNHTLKAMRELGWTEGLVHMVEVDDDTEARRIMLADNRTAELATYDDTALTVMLAQMQGEWEGTGYTDESVAELLKAIGDPIAPDDFTDPEGDMSTDFQCPQCGYKWSGLQVGDPK